MKEKGVNDIELDLVSIKSFKKSDCIHYLGGLSNTKKRGLSPSLLVNTCVSRYFEQA